MTNLTARAMLAAAILWLSGCAATVQGGGTAAPLPQGFGGAVALVMTSPQSRSPDWESFKGEWRSAFRTVAERVGVPFEAFEQDDKPKAKSGTIVAVHVRDYRYLTAGARFGFGIMTGNAYIDAQATFTDIATGNRLGTRDFSTSSSAWQGVFSAMTDKQVAAIAEEVFRSAQAQKP